MNQYCLFNMREDAFLYYDGSFFWDSVYNHTRKPYMVSQQDIFDIKKCYNEGYNSLRNVGYDIKLWIFCVRYGDDILIVPCRFDTNIDDMVFYFEGSFKL